MLRVCMTYFCPQTGVSPNGMTYWGRKKIPTKNAGCTYGRPTMHPAKPINN